MPRLIIQRALFATLVVLSIRAKVSAQDSPPSAADEEPAESATVSGRLKVNSNANQTDAPYILVDKWGVITQYLQPSPGVELDQFVDRPVRVRGASKSGSDQKMRLIQVDEVGSPGIPIDRAASDNAAPPARRRVRQAAYQERAAAAEEIPTGEAVNSPALEPVPDTGTEGWHAETAESLEGDESCSQWAGCDACGGCGFCGPPGLTWVRAEYLYWWTEGMHIPPLVTTGPNATNPGFLGSPGTQILFGGGTVNGIGRSGGRLTAGTWLNSCQTVGIQGDYFSLASITTNYSASSNGNPILSRPFFDTRPSLAAQNVEQVALPGSIEGSVSATIPTRLWSTGFDMIFNLCCSSKCYCDDVLPCLNGPGWFRLDLLLGYRYAQLNDGVAINENLTSLNSDLPGQFLVNDSFTSRNRFNGVEIGTLLQQSRGRWSVELLSKIALGNNTEFVSINGSTVTTQNGVSTTSQGGLLALPSNIGNYRRNEFAVLPQLGANLGYQLSPRWRVIVGYTFFYWSRVARAGDQIDTDVNSTMLPNSPNPPTGDLRHPQFVFRDTDFWAQGINVGLDFRW